MKSVLNGTLEELPSNTEGSLLDEYKENQLKAYQRDGFSYYF